MLSYAPIPTTDLYFLNSCGNLVARPWRRGPVRRLGANVFRVGKRFLIIRRDHEALVRSVLAEPDAEIIYLIDDNLEALHDSSLPDAYRSRLEGLRGGIYKDILARARLVVTSAQVIADSLPAGTQAHVMNPAWRGRLKPGKHLARAQERVDMVHLGTGSHGAGYSFLIPVLEEVLAAVPHSHFHYFGNAPLLATLDGHARVHRMRAKTWAGYKRALPGFRFHLGLYPLVDTPFNAARSVNKILEYTLAGCPAMYSAQWAEARGLSDSKTAFLAPDDAGAWAERLKEILAAPAVLQSVYEGACAHYDTLNDLAAQRQFWQDTFIRDGR
ncbi:glycosyltransferase [Kordiimonas gwangyangensis]|uniref:glycosyltransferase n=1 Tax=Kordiimonas gwangyangensis TaxID=288022 RepID=UPI00037095C4|nr:hypothetical protein [Kordiimonas gwangyangensis]